MTATISGSETAHESSRWVVLVYLGVSAAVLLLMMLVGLLLRIAQGALLTLPPDLLYQAMTLHGTGMVGIAALASVAIMWFFLGNYVSLKSSILIFNLMVFLIGLVLILWAVLVGGFAGAWTFLYPLPAHSSGVWERDAAAFFLAGLLLIGSGFLVLYLEVGRAIIERYGNLARALGWPQLFGGDRGEAPPPAVVASTMVLIVQILALVSGAAILAMSLINLYLPRFAIDALLAKNLTYFFGHVFINATIYMAVIAVYEILPRYARRPWKANRVFLGAWTASLIMVLSVYPHHLLMDFVMPRWALILGQVLSYMNGLPVMVVTAYGACMLVYRSGMRWDVASGLLFLSMFGWAAGVVPAIVDATIVVNQVMHNTLWVPGHFHFYLLLGLVAMIFGFMYWLGADRDRNPDNALDRIAFWVYAVGSFGFAVTFLYSGKEGVPRRWAVHLPEWVPYDRLGSVFAIAIILAATIFILRFFLSVARPPASR